MVDGDGRLLGVVTRVDVLEALLADASERSARVAVRARALVDLGAVERNAAPHGRTRPARAQLCAVVKADGYGHGMVPAARAALAGGASWLAVATAEEARALRAAGVDGRVLVMGALSDEELPVALEAQTPTSSPGATGFVERVAARGGGRIHVKLDTRHGAARHARPRRGDARSPSSPAPSASSSPGLMTHFATADEPATTSSASSSTRFRAWAEPLRERHPGALAARRQQRRDAALTGDAHFDMVRCGIAIYGMDPFGEDPAARELEPALSLRSYVAEVKPIARRARAPATGGASSPSEATTIATVPIGYGDGWRRSLHAGADVLIGGRRAPARGHGQHGQHDASTSAPAAPASRSGTRSC